MRRVSFDPGIGANFTSEQAAFWSDWQRRAEVATKSALKIHAAGGEVILDQDLWAELKQWLFENVFDRCCAYCEGQTEPQSYGDAEHWRPKAEVSTIDGTVVSRDGVKHPGYFWLAYAWPNLLPACQKCNVGNKVAPGKGTRFPVSGEYVFAPNEIDSLDNLDAVEAPILLHPFRGPDPSEHLGFNEFGDPHAIRGSEYAEASISVFALDREGLRVARSKRQKDMRLVVKEAIARCYEEGVPIAETIGDYLNSDPEYSSARRHYAWWHYDRETLKLREQMRFAP